MEKFFDEFLIFLKKHNAPLEYELEAQSSEMQKLSAEENALYHNILKFLPETQQNLLSRYDELKTAGSDICCDISRRTAVLTCIKLLQALKII